MISCKYHLFYEFSTSHDVFVYVQECIDSFEYPVKGDTGMSGEWDEDDEQYTPYRRVLILDASRMPEIIVKVKDAVY